VSLYDEIEALLSSIEEYVYKEMKKLNDHCKLLVNTFMKSDNADQRIFAYSMCIHDHFNFLYRDIEPTITKKIIPLIEKIDNVEARREYRARALTILYKIKEYLIE